MLLMIYYSPRFYRIAISDSVAAASNENLQFLQAQNECGYPDRIFSIFVFQKLPSSPSTFAHEVVMAQVEEEVEEQGNRCNSDIASDQNQEGCNENNTDIAVAVGCTSAAVVGAVPLAVVGSVQAIGFSTGGIVAGSTAATMMAADVDNL